MHRYLLTFYKKGNMRFISHLDLQNLFRRAIKRGEVRVAYSCGYNPHELINVVQPLSLGFEGEAELFEIDTEEAYTPKELLERMNRALPDDIRFYSCEETERKNKSTSCSTDFAEYEVSLCKEELSQKLRVTDFKNQSIITILKKEKKSGNLVEKDVTEMLKSMELTDDRLLLKLACGANATLNPTNLLESLFKFSELEYGTDSCRITRKRLCKVNE